MLPDYIEKKSICRNDVGILIPAMAVKAEYKMIIYVMKGE